MKKSIALLLSASLAFGSVPAAFAAQTSFAVTTDVSAQTSLADKYKAIVALFPAEGEPDLAEVKAQYEANFQADVKVLNAELDTLITQTLDLAIEGKLSAGQAKQAVDKGLQWYFYLAITDLTRYQALPALEKGDKAAATAALDKAIELYANVLEPTAVKRDNYYLETSTPVEMKDTLATAVKGLQQAVKDGNVLNYKIYRQMFDKSLIKVFHLATLKYAKTAPTAEPAKAQVEMTEGFFFFLPIYGSLSGGSKADADAIRSAFGGGDPSKLSEAAIKQHYAAALNGKIGGYATRVLTDELPGGKHEAAIEHAVEGNMFLVAEEVLIKEKLGAEAYAEALAHAEQYLQAVRNKNAAAANEHVVAYLKIVAKLDGVVLKIGEAQLTVDGAVKTVDAASYVNPQTNRTLVPTRFIAEAIGASVDFNDATQVVTIVKGGQTIELKLGSADVSVNGEVVADKKLDQTVVVSEAGRSFIPLRAVAELFGSNVFYSNGEVVITE
ncbi:copper amine oxidase N-terminal domain-containing protein [Paenibacillus sp.]|uniref:copper amine oxidase N-terminal domain-containing protein n=1 Tax=Paenibacillus sp. TaxID=58172 RepID=UPI002D587F51|nr:copper amine oxidase N-terminal domain-containing protein [Paenibacillus sp.]HZG88091.1 copper amine oxidase N-terminal domain-containing protein [Paenibacillus sp.]